VTSEDVSLCTVGRGYLNCRPWLTSHSPGKSSHARSGFKSGIFIVIAPDRVEETFVVSIEIHQARRAVIWRCRSSVSGMRLRVVVPDGRFWPADSKVGKVLDYCTPTGRSGSHIKPSDGVQTS